MDENEKSWFERIYGPTWRSIKDPETYKGLLDLSSYGDVVDAPGAGEGLEELYNYIGGPSAEDLSDLASSYEGMDYKYPKMAWDAGAFGVNTVKDILQFVPDMGTDALQTGWARTPTWMGGGGQNLLSTDAKLQKDAWLHDKLGRFSWYDAESNPYTNPELKNYYEKLAGDSASKYFTTFEDKGGWLTEEKDKKIWDAVDKKLNWDDWVEEDPYRSYDEYKKTQNLLWNEEFMKQHGDKFYDYFWDDVDRSLMEHHGIGADKGAISNFEFGIGKGDLGGYASMGQPLLPYFTPEKDVLYDAHKVTELAGGPGIIKGALKTGRKLFPKKSVRSEGIMDNVKRLEGPAKSKYDWAEQWFRDRGAL